MTNNKQSVNNDNPTKDSLRSTGRRLRDQAEARLWKNSTIFPEVIDILQPEATRQMLHELRVHQIELEMQNEELREAQVVLNVARARYFDLYDLAPLSYMTFSEQGIIQQANLAAADLLGMSRSELIKKPLSKLIFREDQDTFYLKRNLLIQSGEPQTFELRFLKKNDTQFWVQMAVTINHNEYGVSEIRAVLSDITERKRTEYERVINELALLNENLKLDHARLEAEKANMAKSDCLSCMSHELRTPLNSILGFAQLLSSGSSNLTQSQEKCVAQIVKAGWYLLNLVNEILDIALVESGQILLTQDVISLSSLLCECQELVEPQATQRDIRVDFSCAIQPYFVRADHTRLKQVIINLLTNAIKYSHVGGIVVVSSASIESGRVRISIKDYGPGLSQEKINRLFEPFNRLGQEHITEGTGVGLVVSKRLINLMGGVIGLDTAVGEGSVFWVEMPLMPDV